MPLTRVAAPLLPFPAVLPQEMLARLDSVWVLTLDCLFTSTEF